MALPSCGVAGMNKGFLRAGHLPTLIAAFLYFDLSFMVWVMLGPLGVQIAKDLHLEPGQKGLMVAIPVLAGAVLRIVIGVLVDHLKPKRAGTIAQIVVVAGLVAAWFFGVRSYPQVLLVGVVLGLAGAGNSGTVLAALFAPALGAAFGWQTVFGLAAIPLSLTLVTYLVLAEDSPACPPPKPFVDYLKVLQIADAWWFMFFYSVTFGGFVGLASSLTIYFNDQYGLSAIVAGYFTAACVFAGSMVRPVGGAIADRVGGVRSLSVMYVVAAAAMALVSLGLPQAWMALVVFVVGMLALGMGNGAVFQLVPQRFRGEIGVMTGLVGMTGGLGGFYLASSLGYSKQFTGSYQAGFLLFAALATLALVGLVGVKKRWRSTWGAAAGLGAARV
jgi:MFS transporter, NNP family, nitrate/nitrite transporter